MYLRSILITAISTTRSRFPSHMFLLNQEAKLVKKALLRFILCAIIIYLTSSTLNPAVAVTHPLGRNGTHFCGVIDYQFRLYQDSKQLDNRNYARTFAANLNVGQPRTVRMIYFLPNDRPYQAEVVQRMKDEIRTVQNFFADQMQAHGYGRRTFRIETDSQGEPMVHRVDGRHPDSHYLDETHILYDELREMFNHDVNIYLTVIDNSTDSIDRRWGGTGSRSGKQGGQALAVRGFDWKLVAHELGHAFGLQHDFQDGAYIMSYGGSGPFRTQLSQCHAEYLSVHPYFNPDTPVDEVDTPTIKLISPRIYSPGAGRVPVRIEVDDFDGLHQVILHAAQPDNRWSVKACHGFSGERSATIEFDYDGVIPSAHEPSYSSSTSLLDPLVHPIVIEAVDMNGDVDSPMWGGGFRFVLFSEALEPLTKISGDNLQGLPNTPLPVPFVVELRDLNDGFPRYEVWVTFTVTAGGGTLSHERTETDWNGRAETTLTLGPELGENRVEVFAEGLTVTFTAVAGAPVALPDPNLRAAVENALSKMPGQPIAPADMASLTRLEAPNANISDLTGLQHATNLKELFLHDTYVEGVGWINSNSVSDLSPLTGLTNLTSLNLGGNSISDISALGGLTKLTSLELWNNSISDISALARLGNLKWLWLYDNNITDISAVAGLTNLSTLELRGNNISDLSPIARLTNLTRLNVDNNVVSEISAASGLTHLTELYLGGNSITDISAVAGLTHLTRLYLWNNAVSDISAVVSLTNLTELDLNGNAVSDISAVSGLTSLTRLRLGHNSITNISAIAGLTNLIELNLRNNSISNISAVADLTNLTDLNVEHNSVSDISAVSGLTNLTRLNLWRNSISDISPLVENTGLAGEDEVYIQENSLNYQSIHTHIPTLQSRGVTVKFDNRTPTTLLKISNVITALNNVLTVEVRDSNGRVFEGVPVTFTVISGSGTLSVMNTSTDEKGRAQSRLTLGKESNRVKVSAVGIGQTITFSDMAEDGVHIPDPNLRAAIEDALGVTSGSPISPEEMATLTYLRAREAAIGVLIGLEFATNLTELRLGRNNITDISPLSGLTNLRRLGLGRNGVTDISPLSGLTNLRTLGLSNNGIKDASALVAVLSGLTNLTELHLRENRITDISSLSRLTHLTELRLGNNNITDIAPLASLTDLTNLHLSYNQITDISPLSGLTHLTELRLAGNRVRDISPLLGLTNLRRLEFPRGITVPVLVRALSVLTDLTNLNLSDSNIADVSVLIPVLSVLTNLIDLNLSSNDITDISPLAILTNLKRLHLWNNNISDISVVAELTNLTELYMGNNSISDISAVVSLTNLSRIDLWNNNISDISPLVENTGLGVQDWSWVGVRENPLSYQSIHTHIPVLQSRGVTVEFDDQAHSALLKISGDNQRRLPGQTLTYPFIVEVLAENGSPLAGVSVTFTVNEGGGVLDITNIMTDAHGRAQSTLTLGTNFGTNTVSVSAAGIEGLVTFRAAADNPEFLWSIPAGLNLIHVPLKVTAVDRTPRTIESIGDLYNALGGTSTVIHLTTFDSQTQQWSVYISPSDKSTAADKPLTDDMGIIAMIKAPLSIRLTGAPLGNNGNSTITLNTGQNLVGLPLRDSRITRVSDLLAIEGIRGNVPGVMFQDEGELKTVGRAGDPGDIPITGGQSFLLNVQQPAIVSISGNGWYNISEVAAAPLMALTGIQVTDTTPVLALEGSIADEETDLNSTGYRVIVKNLSTGKAVAVVTKDVVPSRTNTGGGYQVAIVDIETVKAATVGDILEVSAQSPNPFIGVEPLQYTVTAEDVKRSLIQLPELAAYEIPAETELLRNYPNPFNPETWIPYRLAEDAFVTLTIYEGTGQVVHTLDVGYQIAAVYENRSKAIYWDGRNRFGEGVASGVYFYHLSAGDYSATRKMVILK